MTVQATGARCPGPSTLEIIANDGERIPPPFQDLAPPPGAVNARVPYRRYFDRAWFEAEHAQLWPRVWQWACREEHLPEPGDWHVYDIGPRSVVLVRGRDGVIRGFVNACLHRGMQLCTPGTSGRGRQFLRCPFHGFAWELDGALRDIPCEWDFPDLIAREFTLPQVRVDTWGGFVFINFAADPPPLLEWLGTLAEHFAHWPLDRRYVAVHTAKRLACNWKMAQEAFIEAFHVLATHTQAIENAGDANAQYDLYGERVSRFIHTVGYPSPHLNELRRDGRPPLQPDVARRLADARVLRAQIAAQWRERLAAEHGVDASGYTVTEVIDSVQYFLFPNMFLFPGLQYPMIYRFRPDGPDPERCVHEILFLRPLPVDRPRPAPAAVAWLEEDDSYTTVPGLDPGLGAVLDQDTVSLRRQQAGARTAVVAEQWLGAYQEARIARFHRTLEGYVEP